MSDQKRETKRADELKEGDWTAPGGISALPAEVLHTLTYPHGSVSRTHLVLREFGVQLPFDETCDADKLIEIATAEELESFRAGAERAKRIADIRALADFLERNPDVPLALYPSEQVDLHDGASGVAQVRELGARFSATVRDDLEDRTQVYLKFGSFEYRVIAWHKDGRPDEPKPEVADPWAAMVPNPHPPANCGPLALALPPGTACPTCGTVPQPVDGGQLVDEAEDERCGTCGESLREIALGTLGHIPGEICNPVDLPDETPAGHRVAAGEIGPGLAVFASGPGVAGDVVLARPGRASDRRTCVDPGDQEHDHTMCEDANAEGDPVHLDFTTGESMCGLAAITPHKASLVWVEVTCPDCVKAA